MPLTEEGRRRSDSSLLTALAYGSLVVPFTIIGVRFALASHRVFLPDDLALVDLHSRVALHWHQAVGPFDRFGWNHPGPAYYYLLATVYRVFGNGARAAFIGASLINALAAIGVVSVGWRRGGPLLALWAAACVGGLEILLSVTTPGALTYSEGALGAGVSPWTATVIIVPLLLFAVLGAAAVTGSPLSFLGALLVGSLVVQTDLSAAPLVGILLLGSLIGGGVVFVRDRRAARGVTDGTDVTEVIDRPTTRRRWAGRAVTVVGLALLVVMWIPPVVQNMTNHPGNLDLIYRFFTSRQPVHPVSQGFWATVAVAAVALFGPGEIMSTVLGHAPAHAAVAFVVFALVLVVGAAAVGYGRKRLNRFAVTLGSFSLVGLLTMIYVFSRISGLIYGYLVLWEITMPTVAVIGLGAALIGRGDASRAPRSSPAPRSPRSPAEQRRFSLIVGAVVVVIGVILCVRMLSLPALTAVSDPKVNAVVSLARPGLPGDGAPVFVGDAGLDLIETEEFIGVVNELDATGHHPKVNHFWRAEFGSDYVTPGGIRCHLTLLPWSPHSPHLAGYVGRVGGIAVTVFTTKAR